MSTKRSPIGPGWFIFFQDRPKKATGDGYVSHEQGISTYNKYNVQTNNKVIVLAESGVF
jgi:hypothetical protein